MKYGWFVVCVMGVVGTGCTKRNPAVCCISEADCAEIQLPVGSLCQDGQACLDHACIAPECHSSADCSGATPICHDGICGACDGANACPASSPICDVDHGTCGGCGDNSACAAFPTSHICETATGTCVDCLQPSDCAGATPTCEAKACRACRTHADCVGSNACLPDGSCGTDANTAYVGPSGSDSSNCSRSAPCKTVAAALGKMRPNLKLAGAISETVVVSRDLVIVSDPGTSVSGISGPAIDIKSGSVSIADLTLANSRNSGSGGGFPFGIYNEGTGLLSGTRLKVFGNPAGGINSPRLSLRDSVVANNTGGGVVVAADLSVEDCIIANNGGANSDVGGLAIGSGPATRSVRFSTIVNNVTRSMFGIFPGIDCGPSGSIILGGNNIVAGNAMSSRCVLDYSLFDPNVTVTMHNKTGDPKFKNTNSANPLATDFFRIGAQSAAIDGADPTSSTMTDIDGDARPQGAGFDIGADEYKP